MAVISDVRVVVTSVLVSASDVALNLLVALLTGSSIMLAQALQGISDLITGATIYLGVRRSKRQPNSKFQFGYGREIFFWVLVTGIIMFAGTGFVSIRHGYDQLVNPDHVEYVWAAFIMLVFGFFTNLYAFRLSLRRIKQSGAARGRLWWQHLLRSSIVETKATFIIDFLGTSAAVIGFVSLLGYVITGNAQFDGIGGIAIGVAMMIAAILLMSDVRDLIVGRSVDKETSGRISDAARSVEGVIEVLDLRTMYLGSEKLLVILELNLKNDLATNTIEKITDAVKERVQQEVPIVHHIQVEVESPD